jgi:hypothetical protein
MTFHILANLDQEVQWAGQALPTHVRVRVSAAASLLAALAPVGEDVAVYPLTDVTEGRLRAASGWTPPRIAGGTPPNGAFDLVWANPDAKLVNDRRFGVRVARATGHELAGTHIFNTIGDLDRHLAEGGAAASAECAWVCKAPWTSAGRDRVFGAGTTTAPDVRDAIKRMLGHHPALVFEPWLQRIVDVGICGHVTADAVQLEAPHRLHASPRGSFRGIELATTVLEIAEHDLLVMAAEHAGVALQRAGYRGPFGIDAFAYTDAGVRRFRPLCEINARYTFGHVAHALHARLGTSILGFTEPPPGATLLVAPSPFADKSSAWVAPAGTTWRA